MAGIQLYIVLNMKIHYSFNTLSQNAQCKPINWFSTGGRNKWPRAVYIRIILSQRAELIFCLTLLWKINIYYLKLIRGELLVVIAVKMINEYLWILMNCISNSRASQSKNFFINSVSLFLCILLKMETIFVCIIR